MVARVLGVVAKAPMMVARAVAWVPSLVDRVLLSCC